MSTPQRRSLSDSSKTPLDALHAEHRQLMMRSRTHPNDPRVWIALGQTRLRMAAPRPATDAFRAALALRPNLPGVQARLATLLIDAGQLEEAERLLKNALSLRPGLPLAQLGLARLHLRRHDSAQAESVLAPLLLLKPSMPEAVAMAADILRRKKTPGKALPMLYRALRETPDRSARSLLFHRIAEAHDALDERAEAMAMWRAANSFRGQDFKPAQHAHAVDILKSRYWPGRVLERARNADPLPVFIVGMPRSGTSLLEQMLDSHPQIKGIGERDEIRVLALSIPQRLDYEQPYYRRLRRINTNVLTELAEGHLAHLRTFIDEPGITRVVDKMPHNFQHLGLIGQLFPNARVLRMVRDPVDTCFSCFRQRFASGLPYTNALPWLGAFYNSYADLMDHWHTVSPLPILDVSYEVLVQEPEPTLRAVLDFMGMPWDPACLRFHTNRRDVGTASHDQVKKPLYTSSIGGSRRYHDHLKPLIDVLAPRHRPQ